MKKIILPFAAVLGLSLAGAAHAQAWDFQSVDIDQNGEISFEELQAVVPSLTEEQFAALDADGSGALSPDEFAVLNETGTETEAPAEPPLM